MHMVKAYSKIPVGAHRGTGDWLLQRLTAIVMAVYTVVLVAMLVARRPSTFERWSEMFASGFFRMATFIAVAALLYHAWVGVRDIVMDYIASTRVRLAAQTLVGLGLLACLAWSAAILWGR